MMIEDKNLFQAGKTSPLRSPSPEKLSPSKGGYHLRKRSPFMANSKFPDILKQDPYAYKYSA